MRRTQVASLVLLGMLVLSGCSPFFEAVNGKEVLREESWTRSDGADCVTQWTLLVVNSLDTEDGPIGEVRDAYAGAAPTGPEIEAIEAQLEHDSTRSREVEAHSEAVHAAAAADLEARGLLEFLDYYELDSSSVCS